MRWLLSTLFILSCWASVAQQLIWEKRFSLARGSFNVISRNLDSSYSVVGESYERRHSVLVNSMLGPGYLDGLFQTRITKNGDTLWTKPLGVSRYLRAGTRGSSHELYTLTVPQSLPDSSIQYPYFYILKTDTAANILSANIYKLNIQSQTANGMFQAANGDLVVYGYTTPGTLFGNTQCDWLLMRIAPDGRLKWWRIYNPLAGYACGCTAAEDMNGRIVMVGTKDAQLATQVVDSNGVVVRPMKEIRVNTQNVALLNTDVRFHPDGGFVISTLEFGTPLYGRLIKIDTAQNLVWQQRVLGVPRSPFVTTDSSIYVLWIDPVDARFKKYDNNGNLLNSLVIRTFPTGGNPGHTFNDALFDQDGSATVVGSQTNGSGSQAYIARIANIGIPYDPVSTPSPVVHAGPLYGFPNPASREFTVTGLSPTAQYQLYSISGQQYTLPTQQFDAQLVLDVSALPKGMYFLKSGGRVLRFVKE